MLVYQQLHNPATIYIFDTYFTTEETDPVGMKSYMETEMVNLPTVQSFKYIGSTIDRRGGASKDVENRVAKAWSKWRELSGVICDKKVPTKLKILIYQTVIQPTLLYGCETWPMSVSGNNRDENGAMGNGSQPVRTPEE